MPRLEEHRSDSAIRPRRPRASFSDPAIQKLLFEPSSSCYESLLSIVCFGIIHHQVDCIVNLALDVFGIAFENVLSLPSSR